MDINYPLRDNEKEKRYSIHPIKYKDIFNYYKIAIKCFWTPEIIDLTNDKRDWYTLDPNVKNTVKMILAFFAGSDGVVNENLVTNFINDVQIEEVKMFYVFQAAVEDIHNDMYGLLLENLIKDNNEINYLLNAIETIPSIKKKALWALNWIHNNSTFEQRLIAFGIVEGIFFSSSFAFIFWLKTQNLLPGLTTSNEYISRDEGLHCKFACFIYNNYVPEEVKLKRDVINRMVSEAVQIEIEFINYAFVVDLNGMNSKLMSQYVKFVADKFLTLLLGDSQNNKIYNEENPFNFIEMISIENKTNFFEIRPTEYSFGGNLYNSDEDEKDIW